MIAICVFLGSMAALFVMAVAYILRGAHLEQSRVDGFLKDLDV